MEHRKPLALALALAWGAAGVSHAQTSTDLDQIRQEIEAVKQDYEKRIQDLENRLKQAEQAAQQAQASAQRAAEQAQASRTARRRSRPRAAAAQPAPAAAGAAAQNAFNPGISLILQGAYQQYNTDPSTRTRHRLSAGRGLPRRQQGLQSQRDGADPVGQRRSAVLRPGHLRLRRRRKSRRRRPTC